MNVLKVTPTSLDKSDRRRDWALWIVTGAAMVYTLYSVGALYMIREVPGFVFWLGLAAMVQVLVVITGIMALLVKRSIILSKTEVKIVDSPEGVIEKEAAQSAVIDALDAVPEINDSTNKSS